MSHRFAPRLRTALAALALAAAAAPSTARAVCPPGSTVRGLDVSEFQGTIDWKAVRAAGYLFAIIRVSDGAFYNDHTFNANWPAAKAAGMIRGVYQFWQPDQDPIAQADLVLSKMGALGPGDLPPMLDVECNGGWPNCGPSAQSPATQNAKIHTWINKVQAATGRKPLIYTGGWFWDSSMGLNGSGDFVSYPLVESWYTNSGQPNACPSIVSPWTRLTIWQYTSSGHVPGISGSVDLDEYWGSLSQLQALAGQNVDWAAQFVSQTFPFASQPLNMVVNQTLPEAIVLKNVGAKAWNTNTRLGTTQPRDRKSVFADATWISPIRPSECKTAAAPGQDCKFSFSLTAPNTPGDYKEFFGVVQDGVAWFSDPGQGGPADNQLEVWIHVAEAPYHGQFVAQSYPSVSAGGVVHIPAGDTVSGWIEMKNVGTATWKAGVTKLAPTPRDKPSPLAAADWLGATRVSTPKTDVAPGASFKFPLSLHAPMTPGATITQTFSLVEESVTWFADAPKGGGPDDKTLAVKVVVDPPVVHDMAMPHDLGAPADLGSVADLSTDDAVVVPPTDDASTGGTDDAPAATDDIGFVATDDMGGTTDDMFFTDDGGGGEPDGPGTRGGRLGDDAGTGTSTSGGCGCTTSGSPATGALALALHVALIGLALALGRRRRR